MDPLRTRVLQITPFLTRGGTETFVFQLACRHAEKGDEIGCIGEEGYIADKLKDKGIPVYAVKGLSSRNPFILLKAIWQLRDLLRNIRPQAIDSHSFISAACTALACCLAGIRPHRIYTVHIPEKKWYYRVLARTVTRIADRVVTVCDQVANELIAHGVPSSHVYVIHNGIDSDAIVPRVPVTALNQIGIVARLVLRKGHRYLLSAFARIKKPSMRLHIFGDGEEENSLREQVRDLGIEGYVVFHGFCSDVPAALRELDLMVMPSLSEGLPMALLEAMAAGVPVMASAVNGIPELIEDGVSGCLVPPGDVDALAEALRELADHSEQLTKLSIRGRQRVEKKFRLNVALDRHRQLLIDATS